MIAVIDTSSFLSLVRYYLPFDKQSILFNLFQQKIESGEIVLLDKVFEECKYTAKGIVIEKLVYISKKKHHLKTEELLPTKKFFNQLENQFINGSTKNKLNPVEFEERKSAFLNSADAKIILYCLQKNKYEKELYIVSEETETSNDNKAFKKIPAICKILDLKIITLPELIGLYKGIDLEIK
jgi:hypothetical protein